MGNDGIRKLTMPKWGLSMTHGTVVEWLVAEGEDVEADTEVLEVETDKITGPVESSLRGTLRRQVAQSGQEVPIGGLLAVFADASVSDNDIDCFVESYLPEVSDDDTASTDPVPQFVEVDGRRIRFLQRGEGGSPLVLIHGFTGSLNSWLFNHGPLAGRRAVYALDLLGHGQSSKDVGDGTLATLVDVFLGWLDTIGLSGVHLVGHSLGGAVALKASRRRPDHVLSCTLVASAGLGSEIDDEYVEGVVQATRRKPLRVHLERLFADRGRVTRQLVDELLRFKRVDGVADALAKIAEALVCDGRQRISLRDELLRMEIPVKVLWGEQDQIIPCSHAQDLPAQISVELIPACGHMVHMESAREVNRLIQSFLDDAGGSE